MPPTGPASQASVPRTTIRSEARPADQGHTALMDVAMLAAAAAVAVVALGLAVWQWRQARGRRRAGAASADAPGPVDADLQERLSAVDREGAEAVREIVERRLRVLHRRRVPLRALRAVAGMQTARLGFADGTALLATPYRPGDLLDVAAHLRGGHVLVASWRPDDRPEAGRGRLVVELTWPGGRTELVVSGLDQES